MRSSSERVDLVERTGRGVGIIYTGQLRNGRPAPSYARSTEVNVTVALDSGPPDLNFVSLALQVSLLQADGALYRLASELQVDSHQAGDPDAAILAYVQAHGQITRREVVECCGLTENQAEYRLRRLIQAGRLQLVGRGRSAHYVLTGSA